MWVHMSEGKAFESEGNGSTSTKGWRWQLVRHVSGTVRRLGVWRRLSERERVGDTVRKKARTFRSW